MSCSFALMKGYIMKFEDIAWVLAPYINEPQTLLKATRAVMVALPDLDGIKSPDGAATWNNYEHRWVYDHDYLVAKCLGSNEIMGFVSRHAKISAIKELRSLTSCGLKAAKDAVEDRRVVWVDDKGNMIYGNGDVNNVNDEALRALREKLTGEV